MSAHEATVEVLTAEVRVLMVGSRQVTLSVYRQLDEVCILAIEPFGRVRAGKSEKNEWMSRTEVVGVDFHGQLCRSWLLWNSVLDRPITAPSVSTATQEQGLACWREWESLPLIVLAGLR